MKTICYFLGIALLGLMSWTSESTTDKKRWIAQAPTGERYAQIDTDGTTIIPNGRLIKPRGKTVRVAPHPYGLMLSPDGTMAVSTNFGTDPFSISIIENIYA